LIQIRASFELNLRARISAASRISPVAYADGAVGFSTMDIAAFYSWIETLALLLAGALAIYYAWRNPHNRSRNAVVSIVLISLACVRMWGT
jgi:uncharacterized membrane protein